MFHRILYQSTASHAFSSAELFNLLMSSQVRNARLGITGHLLYQNGQFTQCFEGPYISVEELWHSVQRDQRHQDIQLLYRQQTEERKFPEWSMAFSTYSFLFVHGMKGFFSIDENADSPLSEYCR